MAVRNYFVAATGNHNTLVLRTGAEALSLGRRLCECRSHKPNQPFASWATLLLERTSDKLQWPKMKEASLSLQERQVIIFDPSDEIQAFG